MAFWCLVVILFLIGYVQSQTYSLGFISIDCGLSSNSTSIDQNTGLTYVSDDQFIDTGINYKISSQYTSNLLSTFLTVRSFPNDKKNCYTLRSLTPGSRYLIRGAFMYGNYDKLNKPPTFDLYLGVNYWETIIIGSAADALFTEIIALATANYMQVCLVNKGLGIPFISLLDLRPLKPTIYGYANSTQSLSYYARLNLGANDKTRYRSDPYDRYWIAYADQDWKNISTTSEVKTEGKFEVPSEVMQTAAVPLSNTSPLTVSWNSDDKSTKYYVILHIGEIQALSSTNLREFNISANGQVIFEQVVPDFLSDSWVSYTHHSFSNYSVSLTRTSRSTLPPLLNAIELYIIRPILEVPTDEGDVTAISAIKANYKVDKGWNGDPCVPINLTWSGVSCNSNSLGISRITGLNLSSSGLTGAMISAFGDLTSLKTLDLSWNKLSGSMPTSLDGLTVLTLLDISGNSLTLSPGLQKKQQSGFLTVINSNSTPPCTSSCDKKKSWVVIAIVAAVVSVMIVVSITIILLLRRRRNNISMNGQSNQNYGSTAPKQGVQLPVRNSSVGNYPNAPQGGDGMMNFENRQFSYEELKMLTNNFQNNIGTGGFGSVFVGRLENGTHVAVKMRSHSSSQGIKEFLAEAKNLTRVHHKNLVSLIGYCMEGECMALVYEYMREGTLQDKLRNTPRPLTWKQRLQIAYESSLGLDYLHTSCSPPIIHRDVKTNNILLNSNLEAKIADFGLSREFDNDGSSHVSTRVVGTPGYLDPEYYTMYRLTEKSDVFSFGVVLLEIVTGQPPTIGGREGVHVSQWVKQRLSKGDIESIVDERMVGQYDINSVWKVTTLAEKCTEKSSSGRPTMNMIVAELRESLELEISTEGSRNTSTTYTSESTNQYNYSRNDNLVSDVSQNSGFEMAYVHRGTGAPGPSAR